MSDLEEEEFFQENVKVKRNLFSFIYTKHNIYLDVNLKCKM